MQEQPTFHLGLTMAGAVSAGAYTAGVIDYLLEALATWEKYKQEGHPTLPIPQHQVKIEVVGGASAGGVTAALMALAAKVGIEPVREADYEDACKPDFQSNNLLFDAWVNMVDEPARPNTFKQMLGTKDIEGSQVPSLLNSKVIDDIANEALKKVEAQWGKGQNLPPYIAEDLDVLLTLCSLKGIPMGIDFDSDLEGNQKIKPSYQMQTHKLLARFNYQRKGAEQSGAEQDDRAYGLEAADMRQRLIACAKSTAAFPIGLAARPLEGLSKKYLMHQFATFGQLKEDVLERMFEGLDDPFNCMSIDGGTLNNEPFGETEILLKKGNANLPKHCGIVLIDPFPNFTEPSNKAPKGKAKKEVSAASNTLETVLSPILSTLIHQGRFKEQDLEEVVESKAGCKKNMIFPSRRDAKRRKVEGNHLACGALSGFSGFIDRQFRVHDFFLGRKNCRNFLRYFFVLEYAEGDPVPELFQHWPQETLDYYRMSRPTRPGFYQLPIIPCFDFMEAVEAERVKHPKKSEAELNWEVGHPKPFPFPQLGAEELIGSYRGALEVRTAAIVRAMDTKLRKGSDGGGDASGEDTDASKADKQLELFWAKRFPKKPWGKIVGPISRCLLQWLAPGLVAKNVLKVLLKDLGKSGLVKW